MLKILTGLSFQITLSVVFVVFLALLFHFLRQKPLAALWCGFGALMSVVLAITLYLQQQLLARQPSPDRSDAFSVDVQSSTLDTRKTFDTYLWRAYRSKHGDTVSPINVAVFIRLVNLQMVRSMVDSLGVEIKIGQNDWVRLLKMPRLAARYFGL